MNKLTIINQNGTLLTDSREVAEMVDKQHYDLLKDIRKYVEYLGVGKFPSSDFFIESTYLNSQNKKQPCFLITRKGCDMVANKMTGEKGVLFTATYVTKFEEMEMEILKPSELEQFLLNPDTIIRIAQNWKEEQVLRIAAEAQIEKDRPKVLFAEALEISDNSILIGDLAKILRQNGIDIGQNRLFEKLRKEEYLISRKGESYNMPTQKGMDLKLFEIKTRTVNNPDGSVRTTRTSKVTGKGQIYFINKFKEAVL